MKREQYGPVTQKVLLLLAAGLSLSLTRRPDRYFRVIKDAVKEWRKINERSLRDAIRRLYQSKLVNFREKADGTVAMVLLQKGERKSLEYNIDAVHIKE